MFTWLRYNLLNFYYYYMVGRKIRLLFYAVIYLILEALNYHPPLPLGGWRVNSATDCRLFANHSSFPATLRAARTEAHSALMICMKIATTSTLVCIHFKKKRHNIKRGKWETFVNILKGWMPSPKRMNFRKSSKRRLTPLGFVSRFSKARGQGWRWQERSKGQMFHTVLWYLCFHLAGKILRFCFRDKWGAHMSSQYASIYFHSFHSAARSTFIVKYKKGK